MSDEDESPGEQQDNVEYCRMNVTEEERSKAKAAGNSTRDLAKATVLTLKYVQDRQLDALRVHLLSMEDFQGLVNWRNKNGCNIVYILSRDGEIEPLRTLLENVPEAAKFELMNSAEPERGTISLHAAAENNRVECLRLLLDHGVDVNVADGYGLTALHRTVNKGSGVSIVSELLNCGADVLVTDKAGLTALHRASMRGNLEAVRSILDHAKGKGVMRELVFLRARKSRSFEPTAVHLATYSTNSERLIRMYIEEYGADVNMSGTDLQHSLLHACAMMDNKAADVRLLLEWGANPNRLNSEGDTPLHLAVQFNQLETCVELLRAKKCDHRIPNKDGLTALQVAFSSHKFALLEAMEAQIISRRKDRARAASFDPQEERVGEESFHIIPESTNLHRSKSTFSKISPNLGSMRIRFLNSQSNSRSDVGSTLSDIGSTE